MRCSTTNVLSPEQRQDVLVLVRAATAHDGVRPLSEQALLDVRHGDGEGTLHALAHVDGILVGYAHLEDVPTATSPGPTCPSVELVVDPARRREGHGRTMVAQLLEEHPSARFWSHGDLPEAHALASSMGLSVVRDLWQMALPLQGEWSELPPLEVPDGYRVRPFVAGQDEGAWLAVNARAFASHPEQGRMTLADLRARENEPWFDPSGFLLLESTVDGGLAGFHWTKVEDPTEVPGSGAPSGGSAVSGEVYVVGVDPAHQGRGLGRVVTLMGLHHLRDRGLDEATLYVDGDNPAAIATYTRLGFERSAIDVMYAREATPGGAR